MLSRIFICSDIIFGYCSFSWGLFFPILIEIKHITSRNLLSYSPVPAKDRQWKNRMIGKCEDNRDVENAQPHFYLLRHHIFLSYDSSIVCLWQVLGNRTEDFCL